MIRNGQKGNPLSFYGIFPAIATPFKEGKIDEKAFCSHLSFLLEAGVSGIVPCASTGEAVALSFSEREQLIALCIQICQGRALVIPGVGAPTTTEALRYAHQAQHLGADGILVVNPYYVRTDVGGIRAYYQEIHDKTDLPIILYSNVSRTGFELPVAFIKELVTDCPRIRGLKDASSDLFRPLMLHTWNPKFVLLSGEDDTVAAFLAQGGNGSISALANIAPHFFVKLYAAWNQGDLEAFYRMRNNLALLVPVIFGAPTPGPLKYALSLMGFGEPDVRVPLGTLTQAHKQQITTVLKGLELLS